MARDEAVSDAVQRLYRRRRFGMKLGLHVEEALLAHLGNPERSYGCIHVAGTNGKGSVCAILHAILHAASFSVGLYTSPHLVRFNERFVVAGEEVPDDELSLLVGLVERTAGEVALEIGQEPTFFECATAMALEHFRRRRVDLAVIETGMGGRLDATNTVEPLVSAITRIGLEHTAYLGDSLAAIAAEKAGIVKPGVPVVAGMMADDAMDVVRRTAAGLDCRLVEAGKHVSVRAKSRSLDGQKLSAETESASYGTVQFPLLGEHQVENLATALTVVDVLRDVAGLDIGDDAVVEGISSVKWPGRAQVLRREPPLILDGAHNLCAARALADTLSAALDGRPLGLITGMCGDKDVRGFLRSFSGLARRLWVVGIRNERDMPSEAVLAAGNEFGMECEATDLHDALRRANDWAKSNGAAICVTGSLFLAGELLDDSREMLADW